MSNKNKKNETSIENEYMVSVYMTTYFHEKYIKQALDSILSQKVDFKYEIVVSDDASKDATPRILKEYADKYSFIRINCNENNIGLTANMFKAKMMCCGKYLIPLSGDDYWIDDNKLQKQVNFLETHKEYIGVASRIEARTESSKEAEFVIPPKKKSNIVFTLDDYIKGENFPQNGFMMRNIIRENYDLFSIMPKVSRYIDDTTDCLLILLLGNVFITDDITVAYRRRVAVVGEHNFNSINSGLEVFQKQISLLNGLEKEFKGKYDLFHRYKRVVSQAFHKCYSLFSHSEFYEVYMTVPLKYRRRGLLFRSFFFMFSRAFEIIGRKFGL